jgi:hypothetical protein
MINSENQQKLKLNKTKSKEQSTRNSIWKKSNRNRGISKHLPIITFHVNGLNSPNKIQRLPDCIKKAGFNNLLSTGNIPHNQRYTQTKSKMLEKDKPVAWPKRPKIVCSPSYVDIRSRANTTRGLDFEHIKARAHKGGVRIGKTPKKLASSCCP